MRKKPEKRCLGRAVRRSCSRKWKHAERDRATDTSLNVALDGSRASKMGRHVIDTRRFRRAIGVDIYWEKEVVAGARNHHYLHLWRFAS
jgi:hypothetical protein